MSTLLLDAVTWDLCVDAAGNIAVAGPPYAYAQDAASAIRLFQGELWYDTTQGIPYWLSILGHWPPLSVIKAKFTIAALSVNDVETALVYVTNFNDRELFGQVQITTTTGASAAANFISTPGAAL